MQRVSGASTERMIKSTDSPESASGGEFPLNEVRGSGSKRRVSDREDGERGRKNVHLEILGYSDQSNPFGDPTLSDRFVWKKKLRAEGVDVVDEETQERELRKDFLEEIAKAKRRREAIEERRRIRESERSEEAQRSGPFAWNLSTEEFRLQQEQLRLQKRIERGDARPVDILALYLEKNYSGGKLAESPEVLIEQMEKEDLESFRSDIEWRLEVDDGHLDFWDPLLFLVDFYLTQKLNVAAGQFHDSSIHRLVEAEVDELFESRSLDELTSLEREIESEIEDGKSGKAVDIEYLVNSLKKLRVKKAKVMIRSWYDGIVLEMEKKDREGERRVPNGKPKHETRNRDACAPVQPETASKKQTMVQTKSSEDDEPVLYRVEDFLEEEIVDPKVDWDILREKRKAVLLKQVILKSKEVVGKSSVETGLSEAQFLEEERGKPMGEMDELFNLDVRLESEGRKGAHLIKPRYFNRVHYGYEWNKYNQVHYDLENPPPKIVRGYKFNIFYPDLPDKMRTPTFKLLPCDSDNEQLIIFSGGDRFMDLAFRIERKEWDRSMRAGFVSSFDRGVLRLYFNFKRLKYRR